MKRMVDIVVVVALACLWVPVFAVVALMVVIALGRPVFFVQERPGLGGRPFRLSSSGRCGWVRGRIRSG
jgi:lipopolysaccharide/colanic/teichoic acid biosynthesis glycosyltransferase